MTRTYIFVVAILTGMFLGVGMAYYAYKSWNETSAKHVEHDSDVLLEKINKVYKMVVVEGEFADIISHKEYVGFDIPGLRKRALIKVKAKVSVGYDLKDLKITLDKTNKILRIEHLPEPQILSIDTDLNYYDLENGMFNSFTPSELTKLQAAAKDTIRQAALRSKMMQSAREQATEMFSLITSLATENGWKVAYLDMPPALPANKENESLPTPKKPIIINK